MPIEWKISEYPVDYLAAVAAMENRAAAIAEGNASEMVWLLEHPPLYTAGTGANVSDLLEARFPVHSTGRGGKYTYHGPGQRIAYVMLDLNKRGRDLRAYVHQLERWLIATLAEFGVTGFTREGRVGVWVKVTGDRCQVSERNPPSDTCGLTPDFGEAKIAALGVRLRKWVSYHGIALNVNPDLSHYSGIVPCGISGYGVTSLKALGVSASMTEVDAALKAAFDTVF